MMGRRVGSTYVVLYVLVCQLFVSNLGDYVSDSELGKYTSAIGDPGMRNPNVRVALEAWNFCNEVGSEAPGMGSPRLADCADIHCLTVTTTDMEPPPKLSLLLFSACHFILLTTAYSIGVNYGTIADNLPPPSKVTTFLKTKTTIDRVKIFDAKPDILRAFADTNIAATVTVGNGDVPALAKLSAAQSWVANNILPFHPFSGFALPHRTRAPPDEPTS